MKHNFVIGTRGSDLALWQANMVKARLEESFPAYTFQLRVIRTTGDTVQEIALSKVGDKGLFTRQIETELLDGNIDLAVHSLKDLQTEQPDGLQIGAFCKREVSNDVLISRTFTSIDELPRGARVATGSLRRRSQLLNRRPDLQIVEIRGNVPTRLDKFASAQDVDGLILAYAGLHRLGLTDRFQCSLIPSEVMLPAVGQGAVAVEIRSDADASLVAASLNDRETEVAVTAERAFLRRLEGGCQVPIGAAAIVDRDDVILEGLVGSLDGRTQYRKSTRGKAGEAPVVGTSLAEELIGLGAAELISESREEQNLSAGAVL